MPDSSHAVAFLAGALAAATLLLCLRAARRGVVPQEKSRPSQSRAERKLIKLQRNVQEIVAWGSAGVHMLGLMPRLWIEVLDPQHRYASFLYGYFSRWELSNTEEDFFHWLDKGPGSFIDLPNYPRRFLEESRIIYLTRAQQCLFEVRIRDGRFCWDFDDEPVSLPPRQGCEKTAREAEVDALLGPRMELGQRRDRKLASARLSVQEAIARGEAATRERLEEIARPLIEEGLLCQLRDPWFSERVAADRKRRMSMHSQANERRVNRRSTPVSWVVADVGNDPDVLPECYLARGQLLREPLPHRLKPDLDWEDFLRAIDHDEGLMMEKTFRKSEDCDDGIFVVDKFGVLHCGMKLRGVFQHSSFVRGHCVIVAGGITIEDGVLKRLSPHSGHYQPMLETFEEMQEQWRQRGVDFNKVEVRSFFKT